MSNLSIQQNSTTWWQVLIVLISFICTNMLCAAEVEGLYRAEVPVVGQGKNERKTAIGVGLKEVLIKVSGNREIATLPELKPILGNPMRLVQQFRYRELPEDKNQIESAGHIAKNKFTQLLKVDFDPLAVDQALLSIGMPIWGRARPATLVWVAVEDQESRYLLGADLGINLQQLLQAEAQRRAIPILIPLMDLEDQSMLRYTDVWGDFQGLIIEASQRYQTEAVLVGRIFYQWDRTWQARWSLYQGETKEQWSVSGVDQLVVVASGIDRTADYLASRFSNVFAGVEAGDVHVKVTGINTLDDYAKAMSYLESLDPVTGVQVSMVGSSTVTYQLALRSGSAELAQTIAFGNILVPFVDILPPDTTEAKSASDQELVYRLLK